MAPGRPFDAAVAEAGYDPAELGAAATALASGFVTSGNTEHEELNPEEQLHVVSAKQLLCSPRSTGNSGGHVLFCSLSSSFVLFSHILVPLKHEKGVNSVYYTDLVEEKILENLLGGRGAQRQLRHYNKKDGSFYSRY